MEEVFAGFTVGAILALVVTPLSAVLLVRAAARGRWAFMPSRASIAGLAVVVYGVSILFFTMIGIVLGLILLGLNDNAPGDGLGSPNGIYTLCVIVGVPVFAVPPFVVFPRLWRWLLVTVLALIGLFGYLMPYLATWADFTSG